MNSVLAFLGRGWRGPIGLRIGAIAALVLLLIAFVSVVWTPYPIERLDVAAAMEGPSGGHWLGTDHLGRDLLSMLMQGMLTSFVVAAVATAIGALIGVPLGLAAASWGGVFDWLAVRTSDFLFVFPSLVVAILITAIYGPGTLNSMVAIGIFNIAVFARVTRDGARSFRGTDYAAAGRLAGLSRSESARKHVMPEIVALLAVQAIAQLAIGVLAEASLAYVGLGTQAPATSLGLMLREAQSYLSLKPSLVAIPGLALVLIAVALNMTASNLRELLDPRLKRIGVLRAAD